MLRKKAPPEPPVVLPTVETWSVRYRAVMDDGAAIEWEQTYDWATDDREAAAGNILLAQKYGSLSQVINGTLYPPHRLHEVTWTVL